MNSRGIAASIALLVSAASLTPVAAQANVSTTLYVNNASGSNCSDVSGLGTQAVPFCTIQAAANVVAPGQTVLIEPGTYAAFSVSRSGTATAPIVITSTAAPGRETTGGTTVDATGSNTAITFSGVSYVDVAGLQAYGDTGTAVQVSNSNHITLDSLSATTEDGTAPSMHLTGASSNVTVSRDHIAGDSTTTVGVLAVDGGGSSDTITTNTFVDANNGLALSLADTTLSAIVGNSFGTQCGDNLSVTDGSTFTTLENNEISPPLAPTSDCPVAPATAVSVTVDSSSVSGTVEDYNDVLTAPSGDTAYSWAGVDYSTAAALTSAVGEGAHDSNSATTAAGNPSSINTANSDAPGEQVTTDAKGNPRMDDPLIPSTGAGTYGYYDRGAIWYQDPVTKTLSAGQAPVGGTVTAALSDPWSGLQTCTFNPGNSSTPIVVNSTGASCSAPLSYSAPGSYTITMTATSKYFQSAASYQLSLTVVSPAPLLPGLLFTSTGALSLNANFSGTTDSWSIADYTINFGDGTTQTVPGYLPGANHTYAQPGTYDVTLTATDADGDSQTTSNDFTTVGSDFVPYGPARILDTRNGTGAPQAQVGPNGTVKVKIEGTGTIPSSGVTAVALNLTATDTNGSGLVEAYADGTAQPNVSNLNYSAGQTVPNAAIVPVGQDGYIDLTNAGTLAGKIDLLADATGYFTQTPHSGYTPLNPDRLLDTRNGTGTGGVVAKAQPNKPLVLTIAGADSGALPASGITAVALNVTTTNTTGSGIVTVYPDGTSAPTTSNLNYAANQTVANSVIVPVGNDGKIDLVNQGATAGSIDLLADVTGYYSTNSPNAFVPLTPDRLLDTRTTGTPLAAGSATAITFNSADPSAPYTATAFVCNITVTQTSGTGFITAYPYGSVLPDVSNLNYTPGQTVANLAQISTGGISPSSAEFSNNGALAGPVQLIVDVFGYYSAT